MFRNGVLLERQGHHMLGKNISWVVKGVLNQELLFETEVNTKHIYLMRLIYSMMIQLLSL